MLASDENPGSFPTAACWVILHIHTNFHTFIHTHANNRIPNQRSYTRVDADTLQCAVQRAPRYALYHQHVRLQCTIRYTRQLHLAIKLLDGFYSASSRSNPEGGGRGGRSPPPSTLLCCKICVKRGSEGESERRMRRGGFLSRNLFMED